MRTLPCSLVLFIASVAPLNGQLADRNCSSHDHPCRVAMITPTECQVCHVPVESAAGKVEAVWKQSPAGRPWSLYGSSQFADQRQPPLPHSRTCLSCHDGGFAPRAEACPRVYLVLRPVSSMTRGMDCGVCHDPHLDNRVAENAKFLHHEERCTDCHEGRQFEGLEVDPLTS